MEQKVWQTMNLLEWKFFDTDKQVNCFSMRGVYDWLRDKTISGNFIKKEKKNNFYEFLSSLSRSSRRHLLKNKPTAN